MILLLATVDTDAVVTNGDNGRGWMRPNNTRGYKNFVSVIIHRNRVQTSSACRNERLFDAVRQSVAGIQRETRLNVRVRSLIYSRSVHNTDGATSKNAQLCRNRWMRMQGGPAMNLVASASKAKKTYLIAIRARSLLVTSQCSIRSDTFAVCTRTQPSDRATSNCFDRFIARQAARNWMKGCPDGDGVKY